MHSHVGTSFAFEGGEGGRHQRAPQMTWRAMMATVDSKCNRPCLAPFLFQTREGLPQCSQLTCLRGSLCEDLNGQKNGSSDLPSAAVLSSVRSGAEPVREKTCMTNNSAPLRRKGMF